MTTTLYPIFTGNTQLFQSLVYDIDGATELTPVSAVITIWNEAGTVIVNASACQVGLGYARYNWSGSATPGRYEALMTVTISAGVIKGELFKLEILEAPIAAPVTILTAAEAAAVLRVDDDDEDMLAVLPLVDAYIRNATGRNWAADDPIREEAKAAARMLLVQWHENPAMLSSGMSSLEFGLNAALTQLEAIALQTKKIRFDGRNSAGACDCAGAAVGDAVEAVVAIVGAAGSAATSFETVITVADQIQQTSLSDLSTKSYLAYLTDPSVRNYPE
jgi:hypothetical protein